MPEILFICTGNYYRSRFAEAVFNHSALRAKLPWRAFSRGLAIEMAPPGAISPHTLKRLQSRSIPLAATGPHPQALVEADLRRATRAIAIKEAEHRRMIEMRFPGWENTGTCRIWTRRCPTRRWTCSSRGFARSSLKSADAPGLRRRPAEDRSRSDRGIPPSPSLWRTRKPLLQSEDETSSAQGAQASALRVLLDSRTLHPGVSLANQP